MAEEPEHDDGQDGLEHRAFMWAEQVIYGVAALALVAGALALLVDGIVGFVDSVGDDVVAAATELLSVLLLVFVFVELLGAVRVTIRERQLIAEPFLLVGIIASIKEIVVVAGAERPEEEGWQEFAEAMIEVGALALVILILAISALLLRRREREPAEESTMTPAAWFLSPDERGNPATEIDRRRHDGLAYTDGNDVRVLIHGAEYFPRLHSCLRGMKPDEWVHFTDWRGDPDERLDGPGTEIARVLADLAAREVHVRGLVWRSHADQAHFSEQENLHLVETVNEAGGEVLLDERVRRDGSHHQKLFVIRHPDRPDQDVAFVGGIDLCHGRRDDAQHRGDEQAIELDPRYGPRPPWHDIQLEVHGPAVGDLAWTFRERWEDPTPLDHRNPWRSRLARVAREPRRPDPLPPMPPDPKPVGHHAVQVLRTYPAKRPPHPFAPDGERSIARAYLKAFQRARRLVYVEDQYLWSGAAAGFLADRLRAEPRLHLVAIVPRYPDRDGRLSGPPYRIGQQRAVELSPPCRR